jgi:hypothetical protein
MEANRQIVVCKVALAEVRYTRGLRLRRPFLVLLRRHLNLTSFSIAPLLKHKALKIKIATRFGHARLS